MLRRKKGFTLIELLIVIAIIGILAAIAIPMYKSQTIKAKLTEVTNSMSATAAAVAAYYQDNYMFPQVAQTSVAMLSTTLGVAIPSGTGVRISSVNVTANTGVISFWVGNIDTSVNGSFLRLTPTTSEVGAILWSWTGDIASTYVPKR